MKRITILLVTLALVFGLAGSAQAYIYTFVTLNVPGAVNTFARGINDSGDIVGFYWAGSGQHGFVYDGSTYTTLNIPGATNTFAYGINNLGDIAGYSFDGSHYSGFVYDGGTYTTLDVPGASQTHAYGINDSGFVVGKYVDDSATTHGFVYDGSSYTTLDVPGATDTYAEGINDSGDIVGKYYDGRNYHGFVYDGSTYATVDAPSDRYSEATGINDSGLIVGWYQDCCGDLDRHGFVYDGSTYTTLDVPEASYIYIYVLGVNNSGDIVGYYADSNTVSSFIAYAGPAFEEMSLGPVDIEIRDISGNFLTGRTNPSSPTYQGFLLSPDPDGSFFRDDDGDGQNDLLQLFPGLFSDGSGNTVGNSVNNQGVVVGWGQSPPSTRPAPMMWIDGQVIELSSNFAEALWDSQGVPWGYADFPLQINAINDSGQMLARSGMFSTSDSNTNWCATFTTSSVTHLVNPPVWTGDYGISSYSLERSACYALMMNNSGQVVARHPEGADINTDWLSVALNGSWVYHILGGVGDLTGLDGNPARVSNSWSWINAINDQGRMAGTSRGPDGKLHAVIWESDGSITDLGVGYLKDINNNGEMVGYLEEFGLFLYLPVANYGLAAGMHHFEDIGVTILATPKFISDDGIIITTGSNRWASDRVFKPIGLVPGQAPPPPEPPHAPALVVDLSPDPNPETSTVMTGGTVFRYYRTEDDEGTVMPLAEAHLDCTAPDHQTQTFTSDAEGLLTIELKANDLGQAGDSPTCTFQEEPSPSFTLTIQPRQSKGGYKFGSGINAAAAIGFGVSVGKKNGLAYILQSPPGPIEIERSKERTVGVSIGAGIGAGIEDMADLGADATVGLEVVLSYMNKYQFTDPNEETQQILRSGLILASFFESVNPVVDLLLTFVLDAYNPFYEQYKTEAQYSLGLNLKAGAEAKLSLGAEEEHLGMELGGELSGAIQLGLNLTREYSQAPLRALSLTGTGMGMSYGVEANLFLGIEGNLADSPYTRLNFGLGGGGASKFEMNLHYDQQAGQVDLLKLTFSALKQWGIGLQGAANANEGSTLTISFLLDRDQLTVLAPEIASLLTALNYLNFSAPGNMIVGPTILQAEFLKLFVLLSDMDFDYEIEEEKGTAFSFEPTLNLKFGFKIEAGFSVSAEKSVTILKEKGKILPGHLDYYPLESYEFDTNVLDPASLSFLDVVEDAGEGIMTAAVTAGKFVLAGTKVVNETLISVVKWFFSDEESRGIGQDRAVGISNALFTQTGESGLLHDQATNFGLAGVYTFTPEDQLIIDLSRDLPGDETITTDDGTVSLTISPNQAAAEMTFTYQEADLNGAAENNLLLYRWYEMNREWTIVPGSRVDTASNTVTGSISGLGTFTLGTPFPQGEIKLTLSPKDVDIANPGTISVIAGPVLLSTGQPVPDGTLFTITSLKRYGSPGETFGTISGLDTNGTRAGLQISTSNGILSFSITPPAEIGSGLVQIQAGTGTAQGSAVFTVTNLDLDLNGLPDYWENARFGATGQDPQADPDQDNLTNFEEYQNNTNPLKSDSDDDLMPDKWEVDNNLNPNFNDSGLDPDRDRFTNLEELNNGTDPRKSDLADSQDDSGTQPGPVTSGGCFVSSLTGE